MKRIIQNYIFVIVIILLITGCAQKYQIHDVEMPETGQSIVFGKLNLMKDGKVVTPGSFWKLVQIRIILLPPNGKKALVYQVGKDCFFSWGLKPGDYEILGFEINEGGSFKTLAKRITFSVSENTKNLYIGDFKVVLEKGWYKVGIYDDFKKSVELFRNKFPNAIQPVKNLAIPSENLGTCNKIKYVCSDEWGIDCKNKPYGVGFISFEGVKPINPEVAVVGEKTINTLTPTFEWHPSSIDNITYDIVVYEAASYSRGGLDTQFIPGKLFLYKENIKESKYKLNNALQPKSKYFWSIRLRLNNDVSTWSKYSYFQTIILFTGVGTSNWFSFATP